MVPGARPAGLGRGAGSGGRLDGRAVRAGLRQLTVNIYRLAALMTHGLFLKYVPWLQPS
jgi:hypothetical protein